MQHGSARPLAVKYITVQGRRHSDHGDPSSLALEAHAGFGNRTGGAESHPEGLGKPGRLLQQRRFFAVHALVERLVGPCMPDGIVLEKHQPLQIDLLDTGFGRHLHERGQFRDGFLQSGQPGRDPRPVGALALLQVAEGANVPQDAAEIILAADRTVGFRIGRVERHPQFVEPAAIKARPFLSLSTVPLVLNST